MIETRTALVTGASRGIGRATALRLARDGYCVVVGFTDQQARADAVVAEIAAAGGRALAVQADIAVSAEVERLFAAAKARFGAIHGVVNSAGVLRLSPIASATDEDAAAVFATNITGAFNVLRAAARQVADGGRIVSISSTLVTTAYVNYGLYSASKAALDLLTRTLAGEMRGRNVTVNAVAPGPTATELFFQGKSPELVDLLAKAPPLERIATPEEIAAVVSFLLGPDGGWVNGQIVRANGGLA